jgi:hypothetical protein
LQAYSLSDAALLPSACYCLSGWLRRGQLFNPGAIHLLLFIRIKKTRQKVTDKILDVMQFILQK